MKCNTECPFYINTATPECRLGAFLRNGYTEKYDHAREITWVIPEYVTTCPIDNQRVEKMKELMGMR